jgi:phosphoglycolate phosphatase-like HAD superfamily hydrolase
LQPGPHERVSHAVTGISRATAATAVFRPDGRVTVKFTGTGEILRKLDLPADLIATSEDWGASKPDLSFFGALISAAPCEAGRIVYVGDRLDNDLKPAKAAGMRTAFIRRGPWGYIWEHHPDMATAADWRMKSLAELLPLVAEVNRSEH